MIVQGANGTILCAVAYEKYLGNNEWQPSIVYMHAEDGNHAKAQFNRMKGMDKRYRYVAAGPAIGMYVRDKHGEHLSAEPVNIQE